MVSTVILVRKRIETNTDPRRRCYNGQHFSSAPVWTDFRAVERSEWLLPGVNMEDRLKFWRDLNDYAVSQRGESARAEYKPEEQA